MLHLRATVSQLKAGYTGDGEARGSPGDLCAGGLDRGIRGTEGFVGGEGVFFAGLKTGKLEITPDGSDRMVSIGAGETTFGRDSLVVVKLSSSGEARFAKRLEKILADKSKSMDDLVREVRQADTEFQEQLKKEASAVVLPENGFAVTSSSPLKVCEQGLVVEGSYRTSDENATLTLQVGAAGCGERRKRTLDGGQGDAYLYGSGGDLKQVH